MQKLTKSNLQTVVRALTELERTSQQRASDSSLLVRDQKHAEAQAEAYRKALDLIEYTTGIKFELYGDEIEIALYEAKRDGIDIN